MKIQEVMGIGRELWVCIMEVLVLLIKMMFGIGTKNLKKLLMMNAKIKSI